jgi:hypothetical protein
VIWIIGKSFKRDLGPAQCYNEHWSKIPTASDELHLSHDRVARYFVVPPMLTVPTGAPRVPPPYPSRVDSVEKANAISLFASSLSPLCSTVSATVQVTITTTIPALSLPLKPANWIVVFPSTCSNHPQAKPPVNEIRRRLFPATVFLLHSTIASHHPCTSGPTTTSRRTARGCSLSTTHSSPSVTSRQCRRVSQHRPASLVSLSLSYAPNRDPRCPGLLSGHTFPAPSPPASQSNLSVNRHTVKGGGVSSLVLCPQVERPSGPGHVSRLGQEPLWTKPIAAVPFIYFHFDLVQIPFKCVSNFRIL